MVYEPDKIAEDWADRDTLVLASTAALDHGLDLESLALLLTVANHPGLDADTLSRAFPELISRGVVYGRLNRMRSMDLLASTRRARATARDPSLWTATKYGRTVIRFIMNGQGRKRNPVYKGI